LLLLLLLNLLVLGLLVIQLILVVSGLGAGRVAIEVVVGHDGVERIRRRRLRLLE